MNREQITQAVRAGEDKANGMTQPAKDLITAFQIVAGRAEGDIGFTQEMRGADGVRLTLTFNNRADELQNPENFLLTHKTTEVIDIATNGDISVNGVNFSKKNIVPEKEYTPTGGVKTFPARLPTTDETVTWLITMVSKSATDCHRASEAERQKMYTAQYKAQHKL